METITLVVVKMYSKLHAPFVGASEGRVFTPERNISPPRKVQKTAIVGRLYLIDVYYLAL